MLRFPGAGIEEREPAGMRANHLAEPLCVRVEFRMPQKGADVAGLFGFLRVEPDEAIGGMLERLIPEVFVVREEDGAGIASRTGIKSPSSVPLVAMWTPMVRHRMRQRSSFASSTPLMFSSRTITPPLPRGRRGQCAGHLRFA